MSHTPARSARRRLHYGANISTVNINSTNSDGGGGGGGADDSSNTNSSSSSSSCSSSSSISLLLVLSVKMIQTTLFTSITMHFLPIPKSAYQTNFWVPRWRLAVHRSDAPVEELVCLLSFFTIVFS